MRNGADLLTSVLVLEYWLEPKRHSSKQCIEEAENRVFEMLKTCGPAETDSMAPDTFLKMLFLDMGVPPTLASQALAHIASVAGSRK
ncbi:Hypothetical protein GL50581_833 [Giardia duodenalis ATCC 50581]|uniref:Uncharacterized protein n=1 Tax=Giardia intestinalis (strain ATCC 50581 / GS clone H7) TaxID=598745 RepID=C6LQ12_GIAIB|nr:Hypothetical protein GL50581_833 [Giardia intestinalis ATCC 50581]